MENNLCTYVNQYTITYNNDKTECILILFQNSIEMDVASGKVVKAVPVEVGRFVMTAELSNILSAGIRDLLSKDFNADANIKNEQ